jgi:hypothetical protein
MPEFLFLGDVLRRNVLQQGKDPMRRCVEVHQRDFALGHQGLEVDGVVKTLPRVFNVRLQHAVVLHLVSEFQRLVVLLLRLNVLDQRLSYVNLRVCLDLMQATSCLNRNLLARSLDLGLRVECHQLAVRPEAGLDPSID